MQLVLVSVISLLIVTFIYSGLPNILTRFLRIGCIHRGPRRMEVALTFDDGPDATYTSQILDILQQAGVSATFFVLAEKAVQLPKIMKRMVRDGHDIQIHGMTHRLVPLLGLNETKKQIIGATQCLEHTYGIHTSIYRPTWGLCNLATLFFANQTKHRLVIWSIMIGDWRIVTPDELWSRIMHKLHSGAVIVLHDSDKTPGAKDGAPVNVIDLLPKLIESIHKQGYEFRTVSEWLQEG